MYLFSKNIDECCGCGNCMEVCQQDAISMKMDEFGFLYPILDQSKCVNCNKCIKYCPFADANKEIFAYPKECLVGTCINKLDWINASSGGAFFEIAQNFIKKGWFVCGAEWNNNGEVVHAAYEKLEDCKKLRKSKYALSNTDGFYCTIKEILSQNKNVIFTGTPCQCSSLKLYLKFNKVNTDNIYLIDIICHGAPSNKILSQYLKENNYSSITFRNKLRNGIWINTRTAIVNKKNGGKKIVNQVNDTFMTGYYNRLFYRKSCSKCLFAKPERCTDITLGDAWGIETINSKYYSPEGVSLIILNSDKGIDIFNEINNDDHYCKVPIKWAIKANEQLHKPTSFHKNYVLFFEYFIKYGFNKAVKKCCKVSLSKKIRFYIWPYHYKIRVAIKRKFRNLNNNASDINL